MKKLFILAALFIVCALMFQASSGLFEQKEVINNEALIKDWLGNPILRFKLVDYSCTSPVQCYAEFDMDVAKDVTPSHWFPLFVANWDWEYKNRAGKDANVKGVTWYHLVNKTKEVTTPVRGTCYLEVVDNKTQEKTNKPYTCVKNETKKNVTYEDWEEYDYFGVKHSIGNHRVKVVAERSPNAQIDFVPVFSNVKLNEFAWWNTSWQYCRNLTIDQIEVGEDFWDFPVLVKLNSTKIDYSRFSDQGEDIRFVNSSCYNDGGELSYEIEIWNESGESFVWVEIDTLSDSANTTISMYYSNLSLVASNSNGPDTWSHSYAAVWHMEDPATMINDSLGQYNCTQGGGTLNFQQVGMIDGEVDGSAGVGDVLTCGDPFGADIPNVTFEVWNNPDTITSDDGIFAEYSGSDIVFAIFGSAYYLRLRVGGSDYVDNTIAADLNTETKASISYSDDDNTIRYYKNGVQGATDATGGGNAETDLLDYAIFTYSNPGLLFDGSVDEIRLSTDVRSASWLNTSFQSDIDSLLYFGTAEELRTGVTLIEPVDYYNTSIDSIFFNCTGEDYVFNLTNMTLNIWYPNDTIYHTNTSLSLEAYDYYEKAYNVSSIPEGYNYTWGCMAENGNGYIANATNRTFTVDQSEPELIVYEPVGNILGQDLPVNVSINYSAFDYTGLSLCWYNVDGGANTSLTTCGNSSVNVSTAGIHTFSLCANDTLSNEGCNTTTFYIYQNVTIVNDTSGLALNFTFYEEPTKQKLRGNLEATFTILNQSGCYPQNFTFDIWDLPEILFSFLPATAECQVDAILEYTNETEYVIRTYYFNNATLNNQTNSVYLYLLNDTDSTSIVIEVLNSNYQELVSIYGKMQRYYVGTNSWENVEIGKTDTQGKMIIHATTEDVFYKFLFEDGNGTVLDETAPMKFYCIAGTECLYSFIISDEPESPFSPVNGLPGVSYSLVYNNATDNVRFTWSDSTGTTQQGRLLVLQQNTMNSTTICDDILIANAGTLTCSLASYNGSFYYYGYIKRSPQKLIDWGTITKTIAGTIFGVEGVFWALIILVTVFLIGIWHPVVSMVFSSVAFAALTIMGILDIGLGIMIYLIVLSVLLIWRMSK